MYKYFCQKYIDIDKTLQQTPTLLAHRGHLAKDLLSDNKLIECNK